MRYQKLLKRLLTLEVIGEEIYNALARKTKDEHLQLVYKRLASNELQTATYIEKELEASTENSCILHKKFTSNTYRLIFNLLPASILSKILKKTLKKRVYSRWYKEYNEKNKEFWDALVLHENLQQELLNLPN